MASPWENDPIAQPWESDPIADQAQSGYAPIPEPVSPPLGGQSFMGALDDAMRSVAGGFGGADEFAAYMTTLTGLGQQPGGGDTYEQNLAAERARDEAIPPSVRIPGEIGGAVMGAAALAPIAGATKLGQAAMRLPRWLQGIGLGAAGGGAVGFLSGEGGFENRMEGAGVGAGVGAVAGWTIPTLVNMIGRMGKAAVRPILKQMEAASGAAPLPSSVRIILNRLERDNITPQQAIDELKRLGPEASVADVGGENVLGLARAVGQYPGASRSLATNFYTNRQAGAHGRVLESLNNELSGGDPQFYAHMSRLADERSAAAKPLYDAAFNAEWQMSDDIARMLQDPDVKSVLPDAIDNLRRGLRREGAEFNPAEHGLTDGGDLTGNPSFRLLDAIKRALDDTVEGARDQVTGKLPNTSAIADMNSFRVGFRQALEAANGAYKPALNAWAGPSQMMSVMQRGRKFLKGDPEALDIRFADMSPTEQEMFRIGAAQELISRIEKVTDNRDLFNTLWGNEAMRKRLMTLFPDSGALSRFAQTVMNEHRFQQNMNIAAPRAGSQTAPRAMDEMDLAASEGTTTGKALLDLLKSVVNIQPWNAVTAAGRLVGGMRDPSRRAAEELGPAMFDPAAADDVLRGLEALRAGEVMNTTAGNIATLGGAPAYQGLLGR